MNAASAPDVELAAVDYDPFAGNALARVVPTTEPQREIWLADHLGHEASLAYNESISLKFSGTLNTSAMRLALQGLIQRHEALRATISANGEELHIADSLVLEVIVADHSSLGLEAQESAIADAKLRAVTTPFKLESGPLFRAEILKLGTNDHLLIITAHHIVCDGWSFGILVADLATLYSFHAADGGKLSPVTAFSDYAINQRAAEGSPVRAADESWWVSRFSRELPVLDLPLDRPRPAWRTFRSQREDIFFDAALVAEVRKLGARNGAGMFGTMLAGFAVMLQRVTGISDVVVGIPAAGQSVGGQENLVGHCVNLLPIMLEIDSSAEMKSVIAMAQSRLLDAYEHQGYTFGSLLKKLSIARDASRLPLVNVIFNIDQALDASTVNFPGLQFEFESNPRSYENFELFVNAVPANGGLVLECQYNSDLFDHTTIKRLMGHLECLMRSAAASPEMPVSRLAMIGVVERQMLLARHPGNDEFLSGKSLPELFAQQARVRGDAIAVSCETTSLTYAELDKRANRLANRLLSMGVGPDVLVGLSVERSVDVVVGILGILKAGGGYLPLDPSYPADRIAFIIGDAKAPVLLTQASLVDRLPEMNARILRIDADWPEIETEPATAPTVNIDAHNLAYVIYTSGSTGKPKGVQIEHANVVRLFEATNTWYGFGPQDVWTMFHSYAFDFSVWEIWGALLYGGRVVVVPYLVSRSPDDFHKLLALEGVTVLNQTPSAFRQLITADQNAPASRKLKLRYVVFGGEALDTRALKMWYERHPDNEPALVNMYGITETTVHVTYRPLKRADSESSASPIGAPIPDLSLYLLDPHLEPVPTGVAGELYVGGAGLARGYLNRPDLTAARFIADPFSGKPGARLYRSGDVARYLANGSLEFVGRADNQVKVRGHRIELGEIEARLAEHPGIAQALTIVREDRPGDVRLVAYLVCKGTDEETVSDEDLKTHLRKTLPDYMVPPHFISLVSIPLTENGKIDRRALPAPNATAKPKTDFAAPRTDLEKAVLAEMEISLGLPGVGIHDDFFALGGHSLLAAQLTSRLNLAFKTQLSMRHLFEAPTVAKLAELIDAGATTQREAVSRRVDRTSAPLTVMQERMWFLEQLYPGRVTYNGPSAHRLSGRLNEVAFQQAFTEMMWRQPSLRTSFERDGNSVRQLIHDDVAVSLFPAEDLSILPSDVREAALRARLDELTAFTFDLSTAPLFKAHVFRLNAEEHVLFFMAHHIVWDGWSFDLLYTELSSLYAAFAEGKPIELPPLTIDYGDFATWHRDWVQGDEFSTQLEFWRERLGDISDARELPTDKPRRPGMSGVGSTEWINVDKPRTDALHQLASSLDTTVFIVAISLYAIVLHAFSRQRQLVIGTPVRGRNSVELEAIMGFFNTLLPLPIAIEANETFEALVKRTKAIVVEGLKYPDVPLEQLSQELSATRGKSGALLYQALFSFQDARQRVTRWGALSHENILIFQRGATEDLGMWFVESETGLHGGVTYNTDILIAETAKAIRDGYLAMIDHAIASPDIDVGAMAAPLRSSMKQAEAIATAAANDVKLVPARASAGTPPRSETEILLSGIWREELKVTVVAIEDNFFDLGGHSLLAMQVMNLMEAKTGKRINPRRFIFDTLAQLAEAYDQTEAVQVQKSGGMRGLFSKLLRSKGS